MDAISIALFSLFGSQEPITEYYIGLPCMCGEVVGRIVGESGDGSWGEINGVKMYSIPLFATPHGSVVKIGVMKLSKITEDGFRRLKEYEKDTQKRGQQLYDGKFSLCSHTYSRSMNQEYPRKCTKCGELEEIEPAKPISDKKKEILKWAEETHFSAHDVFDDMNDSLKVIKTFYAQECTKDESGMVLSLHDAELLAYEYARRLIEHKSLNILPTDDEVEKWYTENIDEDIELYKAQRYCSASSAIYKFRLFLKDRIKNDLS